jgi:hypothetical protein
MLRLEDAEPENDHRQRGERPRRQLRGQRQAGHDQHQQADQNGAEPEPDDEERRDRQFGEDQGDAADHPGPPFGIHLCFLMAPSISGLPGKVKQACRSSAWVDARQAIECAGAYRAAPLSRFRPDPARRRHPALDAPRRPLLERRREAGLFHPVPGAADQRHRQDPPRPRGGAAAAGDRPGRDGRRDAARAAGEAGRQIAGTHLRLAVPVRLPFQFLHRAGGGRHAFRRAGNRHDGADRRRRGAAGQPRFGMDARAAWRRSACGAKWRAIR